MKFYLLIFLTILYLILTNCFTPKKVEYNLPENISEASKTKFIARLDKGMNLYKMHCTGCHGIFTKGKDSIPNFTKTQLDNYTSRFILKDPKNHAFARRLRMDDVNNIMLFLQYRKQKK